MDNINKDMARMVAEMREVGELPAPSKGGSHNNLLRYNEMRERILEKFLSAFDAGYTLTPPNEPLTFEERREMDGKPVWLDDEKTWGILQVWDDNNVDAVFLRPRGCIRVKSVIGKKIYRRPPEGEEKTR